jgi:hypothetical protein
MGRDYTGHWVKTGPRLKPGCQLEVSPGPAGNGPHCRPWPWPSPAGLGWPGVRFHGLARPKLQAMAAELAEAAAACSRRLCRCRSRRGHRAREVDGRRPCFGSQGMALTGKVASGGETCGGGAELLHGSAWVVARSSGSTGWARPGRREGGSSVTGAWRRAARRPARGGAERGGRHGRWARRELHGAAWRRSWCDRRRSGAARYIGKRSAGPPARRRGGGLGAQDGGVWSGRPAWFGPH